MSLKKLMVSFAGGLVLLGVLFGGFMVYSSSPSFCASCHIMEPYYQSWRASKHSGVKCVECHFEPGVAGTLTGKFQASALLIRYLTHTYSPKPFARVEDASCLRPGCHVKDDLDGEKLFRGESVFNHKPHFREDLQTSLSCAACHSAPAGGRNGHIAVNEGHCYLCHLTDTAIVPGKEAGEPDKECVRCHAKLPRVLPLGQRNIVHEELRERKISCLKCHNYVVKGRGSVGEKKCFDCHNFSQRAETRAEKRRIHDIHVKDHMECFLCHEEITHRQDEKSKTAGSDCRSCHLEKHSGIRTLYSGRGGIGVPDRPGPMYQAGVDCAGCHGVTEPTTEPMFTGRTLKAVREKCVDCHGDERYRPILDQWKEFINGRVKAVGEKLEKAKKAMKGAWQDSEKRRLFQDANYNYLYVAQSVGIHNVGYSKELLNAAEKKLDVLLGAAKQEEGEEAAPGGEEIFWFGDTEGLAPARFNHTFHQSMFPDCETCHEGVFAMERGATDSLGLMTMSNMERGDFCGRCHNGKDATSVREDCGMCHVEKKS